MGEEPRRLGPPRVSRRSHPPDHLPPQGSAGPRLAHHGGMKGRTLQSCVPSPGAVTGRHTDRPDRLHNAPLCWAHLRRVH